MSFWFLFIFFKHKLSSSVCPVFVCAFLVCHRKKNRKRRFERRKEKGYESLMNAPFEGGDEKVRKKEGK